VNTTVVIAPDSFKGSASAAEIASALAAGWSACRADDDVVLAPMADGGEGTLEAFHRASPEASLHPVTVTGPDDRPVETHWLMLPDRTAVVELAATSGLALLPALAPMEAHTLGFGEAIAAALDGGAERLLLALGGSSSTDGGVGALVGLGARFLDESDRPVPLGGAGLARIRRVDLSSLRPLPAGGAHILGDVDSPLLGASGAAHVYGPQKGATPSQVTALDEGLANLARAMGLPDEPGAGAAGGAAYGMLAWGATASSGASAVGDAIGLPALLSRATVVITGEGRFDSQSAKGKVTQYVSGLARDSGARVLLAAGSITADTRGYAIALGLDELAGSAQRAILQPCRFASLAGARLARVYSAMSP
jgi:glycerate kinase